ncbi:PEP-CTERM sorting domain-containing protein [Sphingomonas sp.]|uniref:PEP-CTERM sorting domain-containing protein n=1 Tax=Sphingomonas sp. TaxID=28214 RepID=UPI000DB5A96F|nr:PEP-CTERM sorting domain-containing protein [Sphingomonas sp.]PZU10692.1 MAG: hypothetical protein DI605_03290 [Sphingomonas sp.]
MMGQIRSQLFRGLLPALAAFLPAAPPAEATAFGTIRFDQPSGTVEPGDSIELKVTFTLDANSAAIIIKNGALISGGFTDAELLANGIDPSRVITQELGLTYSCNGETFGFCAFKPYRFESPPYQGPTYFPPTDFTLNPGESITALVGTYIPYPAPIAPGVYTLYDIGVLVAASGYISSGGGHPVYTYLLTSSIANTCPDQSADCAFTRTVASDTSPVPEPANWAAMTLGFGALGLRLRRRRAIRVTTRSA